LIKTLKFGINEESKRKIIDHLSDIHTLKWSNDGKFFASSGKLLDSGF
jgi:hypothetical protein